MSPRPLSRRRIIALGGLGVASLAAGATGWVTSTAGATAGGRLQPAETGADLAQPRVLDSQGGRLAVELTAAPGVRLAGRDTTALGFNGTSPGPTLRVRPGDELAVRLTNHLDQPTNLHTHGLRVSPQANSDNPFITVDPGTSFDYLYRIPPDHPAGTFWYHPHHHGVVADQIFGGLAGALLVAPPGQGPDLPVAQDRVLLITDTTLDADGHVAPVSAQAKAMGRQGELVLVNGQHQPTIPATPDAAQRWRIINACTSRVLAVRLAGHPLVQVAQDGTFLPAPASRDRVVLAPGNRIDVIVTPRGAGRFTLTAEAFDRGGMGAMGGADAAGGPATLATMVTSGTPVTTAALPATLPAETPPTGTVTNQRQTTFQMGMGAGGMGTGGMAFTIDGRTFDAARDDQTIPLGATEEWTVNNPSPLAHPFHLHAWPFTVLALSDGTPPVGVPQDVVLIPARGWVRLRIPFTRFSGRSVYHCHILDHEDAGMMATVNVHS